MLDLAPIIEGGDAAQALRNARDLAQHAERWGYRRFWLAEHHNMPGIASAATAVVIGHVAAGTSTIRVGSGGVMLPNHAPLMVAEGNQPPVWLLGSSGFSAQLAGRLGLPFSFAHHFAADNTIPAASTSASAARPAPTWARRARCAATSRRQTISLWTSSS